MSDTAEKFTFRMQQPESLPEGKFQVLVPELFRFINASLPIAVGDEDAYKGFLDGVAGVILPHKDELIIPTPLFDKEMAELDRKGEFGFLTPWGGVLFYDKHRDSKGYYTIKKDLVIRGPARVLGIVEFHNEKFEQLDFKEGYAIAISSDKRDGRLMNMVLAKPGTHVVLDPMYYHGIITLTNCVVEENATKDTGTDLHYVFSPYQPNVT